MFVPCADNDPHDDLQPVSPQGSCAGCLAGAPEFCGSGDYISLPAQQRFTISHATRLISACAFHDVAAQICSSCNVSVVPYCGQCCPRNYTEEHYDVHPEDWHKHPPMFLAQQSTEDTHADLCATRWACMIGLSCTNVRFRTH